MDQAHKLVFLPESPHPEDGRDIDLLNDETFGSGAVDDDWEGSHDDYVEQQSRNGSISSYTKPMDEEELELSNQQLAAAVEELVLNSDQDQDVIDPAIVSLRKESKGSYSPKFTQNLMSPYMGEQGAFGRSSPLYSSQSSASSVFQNNGLRNIWNTPETDMHDSYPKSPSMIMERQLLNEKLRNMMKKSKPDVEFEDTAILTAVKSASVPMKKGGECSLSHGDVFHPLFGQKPLMMKAEDLEKELSNSDIRSPSPTYGISIPKEREGGEDNHDRSLPARSVSPIIGSPSSNALPIGTPPKHITDMLQQARMQSVRMPRHPVPVVAALQQRPRHGFHMPRMRGMPPNQRVPNMWPMTMMRPPMNPLLAKDFMNKLGANNNLQMMVGSPPRNMSPMGSPRGMHPAHTSMRPMLMRPVPIGMGGPMRIPPPYPNQRMRFPPFPIMHLGPGHLHPEHSRFVRMRRQQRGQHRPYNNHHRHNSSRDPYSNLMTSREKEWVIKIQMMALQSDRPEIDDYYYQRYIEKKLKEGNLSLDDDNSEQKRLITPTKANPDNKKYVPVQYDNSLGKLTVSSVYNPRQIIDVIHPEKDDDQPTEPVDMNMSMNKRLEIYSVIEKCYSLVLVMEENQFEAVNGHLGENHGDSDKKNNGAETKDQSHMKKINGLLLPTGGLETLIQCLRIRKGKRLICRLLPHMTLDVSLQVIVTLIKQLPVLIKKDIKENLLHEFYNPVCQTLCRFDLDAMVSVISALTPLWHSVCRDKFGLSLMCKIMIIASKLIDQSTELLTKTEEAWSTFLAVCIKTILNVMKKNKSFSPASLDKDAISTMEAHSKIFHTNNSKISVQLEEIRHLLVAKNTSQDDSES